MTGETEDWLATTSHLPGENGQGVGGAHDWHLFLLPLLLFPPSSPYLPFFLNYLLPAIL